MKISLVLGAICILTLTLRCFGQSPPPNENFSNRVVISGNLATFSGSLAGTALEPNEPAPPGSWFPNIALTPTRVLWWTWTAPETSLVVVEMTGASAYATQGGDPYDCLCVYNTTNVFGGVQPFADMVLDLSIPEEALTFSAVAGSSYQFQLLGSSSTSYQFLLAASNAPIIMEPPRNLTVSSNAATLFTVVAEGYRPLNYQWQFDGAALPGQTAPMLALTNISGISAGQYSVVITNIGGAVTSAPVVLAVDSSNAAPSLTALASQAGEFTFSLAGEVGRNYRIESTEDLVSWTNEYSFSRFPYSYLTAINHDNPPLTSIVFNTNGESTFAISNNPGAKFLRASPYQPANEVCVNNLRQIRFAKLLWHRDLQWSIWSTPAGEDLAPYFPGGALPCCPEDPAEHFATSYIPYSGQITPKCGIDSRHVLEEPR